MNELDLGLLYREDYLDMTDIYNNFGQLLWTDLEYIENGKSINVKAFKITELETLEDLKYVDANLENHMADIYRWMKWLQKYMKKIFEYDIDNYKSWEKDHWEDDDELRKEHPDFEKYWDEYSNSDELTELIGWNQQQEWQELHDEYQASAFEIMDKEMDEYSDNYGNIRTRQMNNNLEEGLDEILTLVKDFVSTKRSDYKNIFDEVFI